MSMVNFTEVHDVLNNKVIKSIEYYNILGNRVDQYTRGLIIRKVTFTDNSNKVEKIYIPKY